MRRRYPFAASEQYANSSSIIFNHLQNHAKHQGEHMANAVRVGRHPRGAGTETDPLASRVSCSSHQDHSHHPHHLSQAPSHAVTFHWGSSGKPGVPGKERSILPHFPRGAHLAAASDDSTHAHTRPIGLAWHAQCSRHLSTNPGPRLCLTFRPARWYYTHSLFPLLLLLFPGLWYTSFLHSST